MREDQHTEFKRIWKDDYLKELCAFANSQGGVLYIGVKDDGSICGIGGPQRKQNVCDGESETIRVPSAKQRLSSCTEDRSRDDNGKVIELKSIIALLENLPNKIHANLGFFADVNRLTDQSTGLDYIGITVQPQQEAISYNGKYYIRSGSTTQELPVDRS